MGYLSECLRLLRVINDKSQKDFAFDLGISAPYLSEIESGKKKPSFDVLGKYSTTLGIPISSLLFFAEEGDGKGKNAKDFIRSAIISFMKKADNG